MTQILNDIKKCTGCTACKNICPSTVITMKENNEGFLYPHINVKKCIDCNKCKQVCHVLNVIHNNQNVSKYYSLKANDSLRYNSTSGAFFPILAEYILSKKGIVYGAAFDNKLQVHHISVADTIALDHIKGSKYIQSRLNETFSEIKKLLDRGTNILFSGTPCQNAGLLSYLELPYDNLFTVDFICHGVPSQKAFNIYIKETFKNKKIHTFKFRDKRDGWNVGYYLLSAKQSNGKEHYIKGTEDNYIAAFLQNISLRNSCYSCAFTSANRITDFTMADYWGIPKEDDDKKGTSLVFSNTHRASAVLNEISHHFQFFKEITFEEAARKQLHVRNPAEKHLGREVFFTNLTKEGFSKSLKKGLAKNKNVAILNFYWEDTNFGALLTAFSLNKVINKLGYTAKNIQYRAQFINNTNMPENPYFDAFREKHLPLTKKIEHESELEILNSEYSTFIVGSDQVWRPSFVENETETFLLNFAYSDKKVFSYAASFGTPTLTKEQTDIYAYYLTLFDAISVREDTGIDIVEKMGLKATHVLDPVFLLTEEYWLDFANTSLLKKENNFVACYTIHVRLVENFNVLLKESKSNISNYEFTHLPFKMKVEDWLWKIKNSDFLLTDSFHAICFAIIFKKEFICVIDHNPTSLVRMESLLNQLGIENRLFTNFDDVNISKILNKKLNYDSIHEKITILQKHSMDFLISTLETTMDNSDEKENHRNLLKKALILKAKKEHKNKSQLQDMLKMGAKSTENLKFYTRYKYYNHLNILKKVFLLFLLCLVKFFEIIKCKHVAKILYKTAWKKAIHKAN